MPTQLKLTNLQQSIITHTNPIHHQNTMISRIVMITACLLGVSAFYYRRKQQFYRSLFKRLQNCQKYQMDYVEDVSHLPVNHGILLYGPAYAIDGQEVINSSFIKKSGTGDTDRLWKMKLRKGFQFRTAENQPVEIAAGGESGEEVLVFNLPASGRTLSAQNYQQRAIMDSVRFSIYGRLNKQAQKYIMAPQLVIGNQQESLLTFLDKQILGLGNKSKILTGIATVLFVGHGLYFHLFRPKSQIQREIDQFKPS